MDDAPPPPQPPPPTSGRPPLSARRSMSLDGNPSGTNASSTRGPPIRQVVGFHVEGVAASPADNRQGLLSHAADPSAESGGARVSSSPNPVLIPPTFNTVVRTEREPERLAPVSETSAPVSPRAGAAAALQQTQQQQQQQQLDQQQQQQTQKASSVVAAARRSDAVDPAVEGLRAATAALALSPPRDPSQPLLPPAVAAAAASAAATTAAAMASASAAASAAPAPQPSSSASSPRFSASVAEGAGAGAVPSSDGFDVPSLGNRRTSGGAAASGGGGGVGSFRAASFESGGGMSSASGGGGGGKQQHQRQQQQQSRKASSNASFAGKQQQQHQQGGGKVGGNVKTGGKAAGGGKASARGGGGGGPSSAAAAAAAALAALEKKNADSIFAHLPRPKTNSPESVLAAAAAARNAMGGRPLHPAILRLGLAYSDGSVAGGSARADALLAALRRLVADYAVPEGKVLSRDLYAVVNTSIGFLVECRPLSASMGSAVKFVKSQVARSSADLRPAEARGALVALVDAYRAEKVEFALAAVAERAAGYVEEGDVVLTYGHSGAVLASLLEADRRLRRRRRALFGGGGGGGESSGNAPSPASSSSSSSSPSVGAFRVIVVDGRPDLSAKEKLLPRLLEAGIPCTYVLLSALSYALPEATKVLLGCSAILSNGVVVARAGSAAVAMAAAGFGGGGSSVPVLVCCETHKFNKGVQLDSITDNELRDPLALARVPGRLGGCVRSAASEGGAASAGSGGSGGKGGKGGGKGGAAAPDASLAGGGAGEFGELDAGDTAWASCSPNLSLLNIGVDVCPAEFISAVITELGPMPPTSVPVILREQAEKEEGC